MTTVQSRSVVQDRGGLPRLGGRPSPCLEKLNRLAWTSGASFTAFGARIGIRTTDDSLLPEVLRRLPPGAVPARHEVVEHLVSLVGGDARPSGGLRRFHLLYAAAQRVIRTLEPDELMRALEDHLERAVAELAPGRLFVHAGVVGWKGSAILIPGRSHTGKSRLVAELLACGATYYSDEFAVLDGQGQVHAYPRPLLLRHESELGIRRTAGELGARTGTTPLPVGLVVVTRHEPGERWRPQTLSAGKATLELLAHSIVVRRRPDATLRILASLTSGARTLKAARGEAADVAPRLLEALEESR
jgi:hypothetical protein